MSKSINLIELADDVSVSSGNVTLSNVSLSPTSSMMFRNRIINGDMRIDQRNAGGSISTATPDDKYPVDRWLIQNRASVGVVSAQQVSDAPSGFTNSVKLTVNTIDSSLTGTETFIFDQRIEGYNISDFNWHTPANAKTVTLSFWVKSSITGQHGGAIVSQAQITASYPFSYTINSANTWEYKTITIEGPPFGTWNNDNNIGLRLRFGLGTNSTYQNTAGTWIAARSDQSTGSINVLATLNATWQITGVQLEEGTVATPFEHRPYGVELSLCQRYYYKIVNYRGQTAPYNAEPTGANGWSSGSTEAYRLQSPHPVEMRATPDFNFLNVDIWDTNQVSVLSIRNNNSTKWIRSIDYNLSGNLSAAGNIASEFVMPNGYIYCEAEL